MSDEAYKDDGRPVDDTIDTFNADEVKEEARAEGEANQEEVNEYIENIGDSVELGDLSEEEVSQAQLIAKDIDIGDYNAILSFGADSQGEISNFADEILAQTRTCDMDELGSQLLGVIAQAKDFDMDGLKDKPWWKAVIDKIPLVNKAADKVEDFRMQFASIKDHIDDTVDNMEAAQITLAERITLLDELHDKNQEQYAKLTILIAAAQIKIAEVEEKVIPELKKKYEETEDPLIAQEVQATEDFIHRFKKRLTDIQITRASVLQNGPQLKAMQQNSATLIENINTALTGIIPNWKKQFVMAVSLDEQKKAADLNDMLYDVNNEMMKQNAESLNTTMVQVAKQNERAIIDVKTLEHTHTQLVDMMTNVARIQQDGANERKLIEQKIDQMQEKTTKLLLGNDKQSVKSLPGKKNSGQGFRG